MDTAVEPLVTGTDDGTESGGLSGTAAETWNNHILLLGPMGPLQEAGLALAAGGSSRYCENIMWTIYKILK